MRFESVSWKPNDTAIPTTPRPVTMAEMFTLKHIDSTQQMPMTHTMMRTRLMKMELEGRSVVLFSTRRLKATGMRATTKVIAQMITTPSRVLNQSAWMNLSNMSSRLGMVPL